MVYTLGPKHQNHGSQFQYLYFRKRAQCSQPEGKTILSLKPSRAQHHEDIQTQNAIVQKCCLQLQCPTGNTLIYVTIHHCKQVSNLCAMCHEMAMRGQQTGHSTQRALSETCGHWKLQGIESNIPQSCKASPTAQYITLSAANNPFLPIQSTLLTPEVLPSTPPHHHPSKMGITRGVSG